MRTFTLNQRVLVMENEDGIPIHALGTVKRIRSNGSAFVYLDVRSKNDGVHPFPRGDDRERSVVAYPESCAPATKNHADRKAAKKIAAEPRVTLAMFGKDHWSTFAYIETRIVDHGGEPQREHMRTDKDRHPFLAWCRNEDEFGGAKKHPTRLKGGILLDDHDDWDCVDDCIAFGLLENVGSAVNPVYQLTDEGRRVAALLR